MDYILIVTDLDTVQINGVNILINNIIRYNPDIFKNWKIKLLIPSFAKKERLKKIYNAQLLELFFSPIKITNDKYFTKLIIQQFLNEFTFNNENILYLDYDHLCLKKIKLEPTYDEVYLSSETKQLDKIASQNYVVEQLQNIHYNNSIIWGKALTLKKGITDWKNFYYKLENIIDNRFREEIAFSLSLKKNNIRIKPFKETIQSTLGNQRINSIFFHYGGNYEQSKFIKNKLSKKLMNLNKLIEIGNNLIYKNIHLAKT